MSWYYQTQQPDQQYYSNYQQPSEQYYPSYQQNYAVNTQQSASPSQRNLDRQPSSPLSNVVNHHLSIIDERGTLLSTAELRQSLDEFAREIQGLSRRKQKTNLDAIIESLTHVSRSILSTVVQHQFFNLLKTPLVELINQWQAASTLDEDEALMFRNISKLFHKLFKNVKNYPSWLSDVSLLNCLASCIREMASSEKYFQEENKRESRNFTRLFDIYINYQRKLNEDDSPNDDTLLELIDSVSVCLLSSHYIDCFENVQSGSKSMKSKEKFFLTQCPLFLKSYNGSRDEQITNNLLTKMLPKYVLLLNTLIRSINQWTKSTLRAVNHLIGIVNHGTSNTKILAGHLPFIDHVLTIVNTSTIHSNLQATLSNPETVLINTATNFLIHSISESTILAHVKQKTVTPTLLHLLKLVHYEPLVNKIQTLLAYTAREEDIKTMPNSGALLSTVYRSLKTMLAEEPENETQIDQLLETLKGLVQHDQMKAEILKQNILPFLLHFSEKSTGTAQTLILEILWAMTFSQEAALVFRSNPQFLQKIQTLSNNTHDEALKKASDGLVWKLIREPAFLEKVAKQEIEEKKAADGAVVQTTEVVIGADGKPKIVTKTQPANTEPVERTFQYDMMISYCHADKDIIQKIHQFLLEQGFKIWIDLDNMFGPAMNAMAEAVENSEFVILCMSASYKQSTYCQAEAEYAFNCKRRLLPLIVVPEYRPDGWLGFMIGSRIYVDFGRFDFETACGKMMNEISLQRKRPHLAKAVKAPENVTAVVATPAAQVIPSNSLVRLSQMPPKPYMERKGVFSFHLKHLNQWSEDDVLDFLSHHHMKEIMPLCDRMDGQALQQLYKMCVTQTNRTYTLLNDELCSAHQMKLPIGVYARFLSIMERLALPASSETRIPVVRSVQSPPLSFSFQEIANKYVPPRYTPAVKKTYDISITSNATVPRVLEMVQQIMSQAGFRDPAQKQLRYYN